MASNNTNSIKILELCKVTPSPSSPDSLTELILPLTYFDTHWFKFPAIQRIFYYQLTTDSTHSFFNSSILPRLKRSLSLTLAHFLPLAGTLTWPSPSSKPIILYDPNDSVSLKVAESKDPNLFPILSGRQPRLAADSHPYVPELPVSDSAARPISLQVTFFPNHGFSIGVTSHHAILDGKSVALFVKCWAHISIQLENPETNIEEVVPNEFKPFLDRSVVEDPEGLDLKFLKNRLEEGWGALDSQYNDNNGTNPRSLKLLPEIMPPRMNLVRASYELCREDLRKLKDMVLFKASFGKDVANIHMSSFVLSFAYSIVCMLRAKGVEHSRKLCVMYMVDCRAPRVGSPLPENYFGNCITYDAVVVEVGEVVKGEEGVALMAMKLGESVKGLGEKGNVVEMAKENLDRLMVMDMGGMEKVATAGSARFGFYGMDFGWGRPRMVEITSIEKTGAVSMAESRDGSGGVEVGLVLEKQEMEVFGSLFVGGLNNL